MSTASRKFLVVDHNADSGSLLVRTLVRNFPLSAVQLCNEAGVVADLCARERIDSVVLHRTEEEDAVSLVRLIRAVDERVIIIVVSGIDRSEQVLAAGATGFLNYDKWLMIGAVVANALGAEESSVTSAALKRAATTE